MVASNNEGRLQTRFTQALAGMQGPSAGMVNLPFAKIGASLKVPALAGCMDHCLEIRGVLAQVMPQGCQSREFFGAPIFGEAARQCGGGVEVKVEAMGSRAIALGVGNAARMFGGAAFRHWPCLIWKLTPYGSGFHDNVTHKS